MTTAPPYSAVEPVTEILHGVAITDPYRWLEDQDSQRTREWLTAQTQYARAHLDAIPGRDRIRERIRELLDVETYDSIHRVGERFVFRKRVRGQEQHCIFLREGPEGEDQLLIDPATRQTGNHTALKPLQLSRDGRLLLYEVKEGGERSGTFELFDIERREKLPDALPRGQLGGFVFTPDGGGFYFVHTPTDAKARRHLSVYLHILGTSFDHDSEIFSAGAGENLRLYVVSGRTHLGFLVSRFADKTYTDFYLWPLSGESELQRVITDAEYKFAPLLLNDRILALTDRGAPNFKIVEVCLRKGQEGEFVDLVPTRASRIQTWLVTRTRLLVSYIQGLKTQIEIFDLSGRSRRQLPTKAHHTVRLIGGSTDQDEVLFEEEGFMQPAKIFRCSPENPEPALWATREVPLDSQNYSSVEVWFSAKNGTRIPMSLVGHRDTLERGPHPVIMTSYGGYGVSMTPRFSVFVSFLIAQGCLFALPNIRGGSEFGTEWHNAAKRRKRQIAFDDFIAAAEWLVNTGRTEPQRLAIFGGSNSGLLVGAAMTQRPDLFRAVLCMAPLLDMLRYHLFDNARVWQEELGTSSDREDFVALSDYSPYHKVTEGVEYPAVLMVSGDADQSCNPLHARKMSARLQSASASGHPIFLDYSRFRGHSPVLPLSQRIEALTDRVAFFCDHLQLPVGKAMSSCRP